MASTFPPTHRPSPLPVGTSRACPVCAANNRPKGDPARYRSSEPFWLWQPGWICLRQIVRPRRTGQARLVPTAAMASCGRNRRRHSERSAAESKNPYPTSPFPMILNGNLKSPKFSILNSQFSIFISPGRENGGGQWPPLRAGERWRPMAAPTGRASGRGTRPLRAGNDTNTP